MSRVVVTDLVPGTAATSTAVNATITSWNDAAGAADLGAANVRQEGIDRRTLSSAAQAVQAAPATFPNCIASGSTLTAYAITAATTVVNVGTNLQLGPMTDLSASSSEMVVVRASVWLTAAIETAPLSGVPALTELLIQSSADAAAWVSHNSTYQSFRLSFPYANVTPNCVATYTAAVAVAPDASRVYWRLAFQSSGPVSFDNGLIYVEEYAR